ncbi:hypothetical protein [Labilithrix luteola]|uniref:hypothetical protein n=1 Tax=Labilithrix luteola TaxID=1391654 RepID=UPI0011BAA7D5|nr:hypothetical protein [Labilithrix luteola]
MSELFADWLEAEGIAVESVPPLATAGEDAFDRAEVEHFEAVPRVAEALCLLRVSMEIHEARRVEFLEAGDHLNAALERATTAREQYEEAGTLVEDAARLVALVKGARV